MIASLFSSEKGRQFLHERINMTELCKIAFDPDETLLNRRAIVWTIAHIAVKQDGVEYLRDFCHCNAIESLLQMALSDPILSMRAVVLMACSFVASNRSLHKAIEEQGWFCDSYCGNSVCLPLAPFAEIVSENGLLLCCDHFRIQTKKELSAAEFSDLFNPLHNKELMHSKLSMCPSDIVVNEATMTEVESLALELITSLNSVILCQEAEKRLSELKKVHPEYFLQPRGISDYQLGIGLYVYMQHLLSAISLPWKWREYVFNLFSNLSWSAEKWKIFDSVGFVRNSTNT